MTGAYKLAVPSPERSWLPHLGHAQRTPLKLNVVMVAPFGLMSPRICHPPGFACPVAGGARSHTSLCSPLFPSNLFFGHGTARERSAPASQSGERKACRCKMHSEQWDSQKLSGSPNSASIWPGRQKAEVSLNKRATKAEIRTTTSTPT